MNPYEAPKSTNFKPESPLARKFAGQLLELRDGEMTFGLFCRWMARSYVVLVLYFGLAIPYFHWVGFKTVGNIMFGILIGILLRDLGNLRSKKKIWKYNRQLLDWDKVERMAAGEPVEAS